MVHRLIHVERLRLFHWFGRRGLLLLMFGALWICYGAAVAGVDAPPRFTATPILFLSFLDMPSVGWVWIACGSLAVVTGLFRTRRNGHDALGFNALLVPAVLWFMGFWWSIMAYLVSDGVYGRAAAGTGVVVWLEVSLFIILAAGWPDPDDPATRTREET